MATLKRETRKIIETILSQEIRYWEGNGTSETLDDIAQKIFDAIVEKPAFNLRQSDPAWAILAGTKIEDSAIQGNLLELEALSTFTRDLQLPNWVWYSSDRSTERALADLRAFVIDTYTKDKSAFQKYQTWRNQPYARGAMSNLAIKKNPENFRISYTDFLANSAMQAGRDVKAAQDVKKDDSGAPITY